MIVVDLWHQGHTPPSPVTSRRSDAYLARAFPENCGRTPIRVRVLPEDLLRVLILSLSPRSAGGPEGVAVSRAGRGQAPSRVRAHPARGQNDGPPNRGSPSLLLDWKGELRYEHSQQHRGLWLLTTTASRESAPGLVVIHACAISRSPYVPLIGDRDSANWHLVTSCHITCTEHERHDKQYMCIGSSIAAPGCCATSPRRAYTVRKD